MARSGHRFVSGRIWGCGRLSRRIRRHVQCRCKLQMISNMFPDPIDSTFGISPESRHLEHWDCLIQLGYFFCKKIIIMFCLYITQIYIYLFRQTSI